jgi:pimeloyl-ACP methyl ester carboxylesterase
VGLTEIEGKPLFFQRHGSEDGEPFLFLHGLGGTSNYFAPLISTLAKSNTRSLYSFDLEGHGLSPTSAANALSISSFAADTVAICRHANIKDGLTVIAHSMGCLVALKFALDTPSLVKTLVLMGPPPSPLPEAAAKATHARAALVRDVGMSGVVDAIVTGGTSETTRASKAMAVTAARLSLAGQDPEGYAKACTALANSSGEKLDVSMLQMRTLILTGSEDKVSPPELGRKMKSQMRGCEDVVVLEDVGHWHLFEDTDRVCQLIDNFLK